MIKIFLDSIKLTLVLAIITGLIYPLVITGLANIMFDDKANGSLLYDQNHKVIGSKLIGQAFTSNKYFQGRPSRAGNGYDALLSGGSNLGSTSQKLIEGNKDFDGIKQLAAKYRLVNKIDFTTKIPVEAVTASASGLDPDISYENAMLQAPRIASVRHLSQNKVTDLIELNVQKRELGFIGEPRINVLILNLDLDKLP